MATVINPVGDGVRTFTYPFPKPDGTLWPGTKTNIWVDVYWSLPEGTYQAQRTEDGVTWEAHGKLITVPAGAIYSYTDSVDQFPPEGIALRWQRILKV